MKIAAIQGYTGKEYKKNFGKKEDTPKNEAKISSPRSGKVSVLKMLPVMLAMAGMQPVATAASPLSSEAPQYFPVMPVKQAPPQVYPKSDSRYDPQYDGESKYLHLNLNELYFYAFNCERSPKLIDMNELFDYNSQRATNLQLLPMFCKAHSKGFHNTQHFLKKVQLSLLQCAAVNRVRWLKKVIFGVVGLPLVRIMVKLSVNIMIKEGA